MQHTAYRLKKRKLLRDVTRAADRTVDKAGEWPARFNIDKDAILTGSIISKPTSSHPFGKTMGEPHHGSGPVGRVEDDVQHMHPSLV